MFSNELYWMKKYELRLWFHWSLFLRIQLTICQHWFRNWLGANQTRNHFLKLWWPKLLTHVYVTKPQWVMEYWGISKYVRLGIYKKINYGKYICSVFKIAIMCSQDYSSAKLVIVSWPFKMLTKYICVDYLKPKFQCKIFACHGKFNALLLFCDFWEIAVDSTYCVIQILITFTEYCPCSIIPPTILAKYSQLPVSCHNLDHQLCHSVAGLWWCLDLNQLGQFCTYARGVDSCN